MWYFHPESDCYFWTDYPLGMESADEALCFEVEESQVPEHIRRDRMGNTIEGTATRVAMGDETQDPQAVVDVSQSPHAAAIPDDRLVKVFVKIRDAKSAFKKAFEAEMEQKFDAPLRQLQAELKKRMMERHNDGLKTEFGTVYLAETMQVSCQDWGVFHAWILQNNALDFLEQRVKAGEVKTYMENHNGELPPGLSVFRETEARVRKPTKRGAKAVGEDPEA